MPTLPVISLEKFDLTSKLRRGRGRPSLNSYADQKKNIMKNMPIKKIQPSISKAVTPNVPQSLDIDPYIIKKDKEIA